MTQQSDSSDSDFEDVADIIIGRPRGAALLVAAIAAMMPSIAAPAQRERKTSTPMMVCSSRAVIEAWNAPIASRQTARRSLIKRRSANRRLGKAIDALKADGPKFPKARAHKQHKHPLRDGHGAYTLIGRTGEAHADGSEVRRIWLGGISSQRGY